MTQAKHTPGPWSPGYKNINVVAVNAKIGGETPVCDIRGWGYLTGNGHGALGLSADEATAIQEANAHLIAAAPEMLEALSEQLEAVNDDIRWADGGELERLLGRRSALETIIAKATGEAP